LHGLSESGDPTNGDIQRAGLTANIRQTKNKETDFAIDTIEMTWDLVRIHMGDDSYDKIPELKEFLRLE
jgi:hypothetical protein